MKEPSVETALFIHNKPIEFENIKIKWEKNQN